MSRAVFGGGWGKRLQRQIGRYQFEVGVLDDKPHLEPQDTPLYGDPPIKTYAGGPVRKTSRTKSGKSVGEVLVENMERLNTNLLLEPFRAKSNAEINRFTEAFLRTISGKGSIRRVENLLQAVVRNPILRQDYGPNKASTADAKGFDRHLFDTGQLFKAIKARAKRV